MPIISIFFGIVIRINFFDHAPPHLHAAHGDVKHRAELMRNWKLATNGQPTFKIEGLEDE